MTKRYTLKQLKSKVKAMEHYLGPKLNWSMDHWPENKVDRWLMEYCIELKTRYYRRLKRKDN